MELSGVVFDSTCLWKGLNPKLLSSSLQKVSSSSRDWVYTLHVQMCNTDGGEGGGGEGIKEDDSE